MNMIRNNIGYGAHNCSIQKSRVLYADTDKMKFVYHANYFRWFEALRGVYMRRRGRPYTETEKEGVLLPLTACHIRYFKPALYDDVIETRGWITKISAVQVHFEYEISRNDERLVTGYTHHAAINEDGRPTRVPPALVEALESAEMQHESDMLL